MAIVPHNMSSDGKRVLNMEEFKRWLKGFDRDRDGRISRSELHEAVRLNGGHFAIFKTNHGLKSADANHNGFIDENEFRNLVDFAEKNFNLRITQF